MSIEDLVIDLSKDPFNSQLNFDVAEAYLSLNQSASAVSFYLRCAEYGEKTSLLTYTCLLRISQCFNDQTGREYSVSNCILQAITVQPNQPEAWLLLSKFYESMGQWQECYTYAHVGLGCLGKGGLPADVGYPGTYALHFQKAVAAWWIGRKEEALDTLKMLSRMDINLMYKDSVKFNLEKLNALL
jgi:tetratricopeptide (TPR) repeat protein